MPAVASEFMSVSEAARRLHVAPRVLSDLFYGRRLSEAACPLVGGRRLIPTDYLPEARRVLRELGKLPGRAP